MQQKRNPIRPFVLRRLGLLSLALVLASVSSLAQTGRGTYRAASGGVGITRSQTLHIHLYSKKKWFPPCDITPGGYVATVELALVNAEGRELARATRRIEGCSIASWSVNAEELLRGSEERLIVRASLKLVDSGEAEGAPAALGASLEISENATGKTTLSQGFDPQPVPWALFEQ
jgi:hypothetical protein